MRPGRVFAAGFALVSLLVLLRYGVGDSSTRPLRVPGRWQPAPTTIVATLLATSPPAPAAPATPPRSRIFGRLMDVRNSPIAGVKVDICSVSEPWADRTIYPELAENQGYESVTDTDGRFELETPLPSSSWISLRYRPPPLFQKDGREFGDAGGRDQDPLRPGDNDMGTIRLSDAGAFEGFVRDTNGAPVQAVIQLEDAFPNGRTATWFTDESGHYLLGGIPAGTFRVSARAHGTQVVVRDGLVVSVGQTTSGFDFTFPVHVANASLQVSSESDQAVVSAPTEAPDTSPPATSAPVTSTPVTSAPATNGPATATVAARLEHLAVGRALRDGLPVAHPILRIEPQLLPAPPDSENYGDPIFGLITDVHGDSSRRRILLGGADGRFRIDSLAPGHWQLTLSAPGVATRVVVFVVGPPGALDLGDIALTPGGSVAGVIRPPRGATAAGLRVGLDTGPSVRSEDGPTTVLDATGTFRFDCVAPGEHQVFVSSTTVTVRDGEGWPVDVKEGQVADLEVDFVPR